MLTVKILSIHLQKIFRQNTIYNSFRSKKKQQQLKKTLNFDFFLKKKKKKDLKSANEVLVLIHVMVLAYCSPFLMAISCAKRL